jgi:hypothetical protein
MMAQARASREAGKGNKKARKLTNRQALARDIVDGVVDLVGAGFREHDVLYKWPYPKFKLILKGVRRRYYRQRQDFVTDISFAVAGILSGGKSKDSPLKEHIDTLDAIIRSAFDG